MATCAAPPPTAVAQTPGSLTGVGAYVTPASLSVATWQDRVLIGTERGLLVQDLTDPANPVTLADLQIGLPVQAITVAGDSALLALPEGEQRLVDLAAGPPWPVAPVPPDFALPNLRIDGAPSLATSEGGEVRIYELTTAGRILRETLVVSQHGNSVLTDLTA